MGFTTFKRTVGLVGIQGAGKTVFLTSLISHLKHQDEKKLPLKSKKPKAEIIKFQEVRQGMNLAFFEHEKNYNYLIEKGEWPKKTADACYFRCTFERTDWWSDVDLTILDFPGERFNDAVMFTGDGSFGAWSDAVLKKIEDNPPCHQLAADYFQVLAEEKSKAEPEARKIIMAYKRVLARLMLNHGALITPSVFALDQKGNKPAYSQNIDEVAASAWVGQTEASEFTPLPAGFRQDNAALATLFENYYKEYKTDVVENLLKQLAYCDKLLIMVDIPGLLAINVGKFNDTAAILDYVLSASVKESNFLASMLVGIFNTLMPSDMRMNQLDSIGYIAAKADLVQYEQADRLRQLLQDLLKKKASNYQSIRHEYFVCSAIQSTESNDGILQGYPRYDLDGQRTGKPHPHDLMMRLQPSDLPSEWPDHWEERQYFFPSVWPVVPTRKNSAPFQTGLDQVVNFILEFE